MCVHKAIYTVFYIVYVWFSETFKNDLDIQNLYLGRAIRIWPECKIQLYCINIFLILSIHLTSTAWYCQRIIREEPETSIY